MRRNYKGEEAEKEKKEKRKKKRGRKSILETRNRKNRVDQVRGWFPQTKATIFSIHGKEMIFHIHSPLFFVIIVVTCLVLSKNGKERKKEKGEANL